MLAIWRLASHHTREFVNIDTDYFSIAEYRRWFS